MTRIEDPQYVSELIIKLQTYITPYVITVKKDWEVLSSILEIVEYESHEMLLEQGEVAQYIYCNCSGVLRKFTQDEDKEYTLSFYCSPGFFTSYSSFVKQQPSKVALQAITKSRLGRISYDNMKLFNREASNAHRIGLTILEFEQSQYEEKMIRQNTHTAEQNYRDLLENHSELVLQIPIMYIASYLGITPESLSRIRKKIAWS